MTKFVRLYYIRHEDNLEGIQEDYLGSVVLESDKVDDVIEDMALNSDVETCYSPLYLVNIITKEILKTFGEVE